MECAFGEFCNTLETELKEYINETRNDILKRLSSVTNTKLASLSKKQNLTFDFSLAEMNTLEEKIDAISSDKYKHLSENKEDHKRHLEEQKELSAKLDVVPQQDETGQLYSEIKGITLEIGEMDQELQRIENLKAQEKSLLVLLNSKIRQCLARKKASGAQQRGLEMILKIQNALEDYSNRLRMEKIKLLESHILEGIRKFFHKALQYNDPKYIDAMKAKFIGNGCVKL